MLDTVYRYKVPETEGTTYTRRNILRALARHGEMAQCELASRGHLSAAAVSVELAAMAREGLVRREKKDEDARMSLVSLTDEGKKTFAQILEGEKSLALLLENGLTAEERADLGKILATVRNNLIDAFEDIDVRRES